MFFKSIIFSSLVLLFTSCASSSLYDKKDNSVNFTLFDINKKIHLTNPKYTYTFSTCSLDTYTLKDENKEYGNLFIEHIFLDNSCYWNGLASGFFVYELKSRMKFKSFDLVDRFTKSNYEISTYKVDGEKYVSIIDMFNVHGNVLIIDNRGKLSQQIVKSLDAKFEYKYLDAPRTDIKYDYSLVQNNRLFGYFTRESESERKIK
ncbi:hypothetical protein [Arcobacter sp.]|uniref:hypothetical protein n=1 Tax=Arcobacter sp. TaxID=1872629 RepID=UPI003D0DCECA